MHTPLTMPAASSLIKTFSSSLTASNHIDLMITPHHVKHGLGVWANINTIINNTIICTLSMAKPHAIGHMITLSIGQQLPSTHYHSHLTLNRCLYQCIGPTCTGSVCYLWYMYSILIPAVFGLYSVFFW